MLLTMFFLLGAVVGHHGMPMDMHQMPAAAICLAVLAGAALVIAGAVASVNLAPCRVLAWDIPAAPVLGAQSVPARAGPLILRSVVLRR